MQPTMTLDEANKRVDQYIADAVAQIPEKTRLSERARREDAECLEGMPSELTGRKQAEREYEILGIRSDLIPSYFDKLKKWWLENGFELVDNNPKYEFLSVDNKSDKIGLAIQANDKGHLYIMASSPCVWPNGTPEPEAAPARVVEEPPAAALAEEPATEHIRPQPRSEAGPTVREGQPQPKLRRPRPQDDDEDFGDISFLR